MYTERLSNTMSTAQSGCVLDQTWHYMNVANMDVASQGC